MSKESNTGRQVFAHVTIGLQLAITMLVFVYGGYRLDLHFNKAPLFLAIGTVIGMILGFYHLMKNLQESTRREEKQKMKDKDKIRVKWN